MFPFATICNHLQPFATICNQLQPVAKVMPPQWEILTTLRSDFTRLNICPRVTLAPSMLCNAAPDFVRWQPMGRAVHEREN